MGELAADLGTSVVASTEAVESAYRLLQPSGGTIPTIVLELSFENFTAAQQAGPRPQTVTLTQDGVTAQVTMEIGYCTYAAPCAGPLELEELTLSLKPDHPDGVSIYTCVGLGGSVTVGVGLDGYGTGNCD